MPTDQKRTRDPEWTRAHILEVAFREVFARGFQAVSVNAIVAASQVTKGAFFHHFSTKDALGHALVDETVRRLILDRWVRPLASYENPVEGIDRQLRTIIDATPNAAFACGCPLNNLSQEMASVDPGFRARLLDVLNAWIDGIEREVRRAREDGFLRPGVEPRDVAHFVVSLHEGAFGLVKASRDRQVFLGLHASLRLYLKAISA